MAAKAPRGYGAPGRSVACRQCGAVVAVGPHETARACDFCGSNQVLEQTDNRQPLRPESVLPFRVDRRAAKAKFVAWLGGLWFRPSNLRRLARVSEMTGMYIPYWTFDAGVESEWTAHAGYFYYVTETYTAYEGGKAVARQRVVQHTRWEPAWGRRRDSYDDVLVCGSRGLPPKSTERLEPFDTRALMPYEPSYLAGFRAEEYSVELNEAWQRAVTRIESSQRERCSADVPGDTQRNLHVQNRFGNETFKHVLLPIWISVYRYQDRPFQFLVNGQTGEVTGQAPYSAVKIAFFCLALAALVLLVALSAR